MQILCFDNSDVIFSYIFENIVEYFYFFWYDIIYGRKVYDMVIYIIICSKGGARIEKK